MFNQCPTNLENVLKISPSPKINRNFQQRWAKEKAKTV